MYRLITCFFLFFTFSSLAQDRARLDSLELLLESELSYDQHSEIIDAICFEFYHTIPDSTIYYCYNGMKVSYAAADTNGIGYYHTFIGVCFKNLAEYDSAIFHLEQSIILRKLTGFDAGIAASHNNLAGVYKLKGEYEKSLEQYFQSEAIFKELGDNHHLGEVNSNLGDLYVLLEEFDLAEERFLNSQRYYSFAGNTENLGAFAWVYHDIALLKEALNQSDSALIYLNRSAELWAKDERWKEYSQVLVKSAKINLDLENYLEAKKQLEEANGHFVRLSDDFGESSSHFWLGKYHESTGNIRSALNHYEISLSKSNFIEANGLALEAHYSIYTMYKRLGNRQQALDHLEIYTQLKDSIFGVEQEKIRLKFQSEYDLIEKESKIKQLESDAQISRLQIAQQELKSQKDDLKSRQQRNGIYFLLAILLFVGVLTYLLLQRNRAKNRLNAELERSLKEREALLREIHHRVKNNLQIVSSLLNLQSKTKSNKSAHELLQESQDRIVSMSIIHEHLYRSNALSDISFEDYVQNLSNHLSSSLGFKSRGIDLDLNIGPVNLDLDRLVPCGLILNELITNASKYAFEGANNGRIEITSSVNDAVLSLKVSDNGIGKVEDTSGSASLGLRLVNGLVRQLKGSIEFPKKERGFEVSIKFNI